MSDQLNLGPESQPKLRLAAQGDRVQAPARPVQPPPVAALPVPVTPPAADAHLTDYAKVVYKRRWTAATVFLLVMAAVTVYTFTATPIFEARTRLLIEAESQNVVSFKEVIDEDQTKADYYQTQYNILQSRALARKTLEGLKLWDHPLFNPAKQDRAFSAGRLIAGHVTSPGSFRCAP